MRALITGSGNMGRAIAGALEARGDEVAAIAGRETGYPAAEAIGPVDVSFEFSHDSTLLEHIELGLDAGQLAGSITAKIEGAKSAGRATRATKECKPLPTRS